MNTETNLDESLDEIKSETSYFPFIMFCLTGLLMFVGFFIYQGVGLPLLCITTDSMSDVVGKYWLFAMLIYMVPITLASRTKFQLSKKRSRKTMLVFSIMAAIAFYFVVKGIVITINIKMDKSEPTESTALVRDAYYLSGSGRSSGSYYVAFIPRGSADFYTVKHHSKDLHSLFRNTDQIKIIIHKGYLNKRWISIQP